MSNGYVSDQLFHFVGNRAPHDDEKNYKTLLKIIESKCISHPPHKNGWGDVSLTIDPKGSIQHETMVFPDTTCYCDIPEEHLKIHVQKYGKFGLGFRREKLVEYGTRPVTYFPYNTGHNLPSIHGSALLRDIENVFRGIIRQLENESRPQNSRLFGEEPTNREEAIEASIRMIQKDFLSFLKPFDSSLAEEDPNNFYMEREWRKFGNFVFELEDISSVCVAKGYEQKILSIYPKLEPRVKISEA